ncbi:MAG: hypothetical protein PHX50_17225 [Massilibacteroides sp.]|nr:hypothetical protein [Massilibacteroides sp.]
METTERDKIPIVIVTVPERLKRAQYMQERLDAHIVLDENHMGALHNHIKALRLLEKTGRRGIVMEDDCRVSMTFREDAYKILCAHSNDLVSLYLGKGAPTYIQPLIRQKLAVAHDGIYLSSLIHAVCYSIPNNEIKKVINNITDNGNHQSDSSISRAWGSMVWYPIPSLVDHIDGKSIAIHHGLRPKVGERVAWKPPQNCW